MIIDFTISNFRCFQKEQTLSLLAERKGESLKNNYINVSKNLSVFRTAGIYGANASGKSNLLLAIEALIYIATRSEELEDGDSIPCYEPFSLDSDSFNTPTKFEIEFISSKNVRYVYLISFNKQRVLEEYLDFYPSNSKATLFSRGSEDTWEDIKFGSYLKGGKRKYALFPNNSYLSKAGSSADSPEILRNAYNFIRNNLFYLGSTQQIRTFAWRQDRNLINTIEKILNCVDTGIVGINFEQSDSESNLTLPPNIPEHIKKKILDDNRTKTLFVHAGENGATTELPEDKESSGTLKLFHSLPMLIMALRDGDTLFLDELDNNLHPHMAELIINLFNDPKVNTNNAQLIFSTHNINLMAPTILRRDQIWMVEKTDGASSIFSLDEFDKKEVKLNSPYNRWYDEGRFGAIPEINYKAVAKEFKNMCAK